MTFYRSRNLADAAMIARELLKSMSIKQGIKYNDPESAKEIPSFIEFHNLNVDEILDPIPSFKNFNEFFYRKLKPDARPVADPHDPRTIVSAADCRLTCFSTVSEATRIWIKGREFTVEKLLGERYKDEIPNYKGGALVIFRLAPQVSFISNNIPSSHLRSGLSSIPFTGRWQSRPNDLHWWRILHSQCENTLIKRQLSTEDRY